MFFWHTFYHRNLVCSPPKEGSKGIKTTLESIRKIRFNFTRDNIYGIWRAYLFNKKAYAEAFHPENTLWSLPRWILFGTNYALHIKYLTIRAQLRFCKLGIHMYVDECAKCIYVRIHMVRIDVVLLLMTIGMMMIIITTVITTLQTLVRAVMHGQIKGNPKLFPANQEEWYVVLLRGLPKSLMDNKRNKIKTRRRLPSIDIINNKIIKCEWQTVYIHTLVHKNCMWQISWVFG